MIIEHLPPKLIFLLPELSLLAIGVLIEKHYVSRVTVLTNAVAVTIHIISLEQVGPLLGLYADIGMLLGIYGFAQYLRKETTGKLYRALAYYLYSSLTVFFIIFLPVETLLPALLLAFVLQVAVAAWRGIDTLFYGGPRPKDLKWFIEDYRISVPDYRSGGRVWVDLDSYFEP